jgi:hypothetical protein
MARALAVRAVGPGEHADLALCVSELVTNAIVRTASGLPGGALLLTVQASAGSVLVSVLDQGGRVPAALLAGEHGQELVIVEALSEASGTAPQPGGGRIAWCRVTEASAAACLRDADHDVRHDAGRDVRHDAGRDVRHDVRRDGACRDAGRDGARDDLASAASGEAAR